MDIRILFKDNKNQLLRLFTAVFSLSEGDDEGRLIGGLASELSTNIDNKKIICLGAFKNESLVGSIFFTRLQFSDSTLVYMLSPVAVDNKYQGKGIGQSLISYGLNELKTRSVSVVVTYGDPSYYCKMGFHALSETVIKAPVELSMPHGWQGQSLSASPITPITERPICVSAFNNPAFW